MLRVPFQVALCAIAMLLYGCSIRPARSDDAPRAYGGSNANPSADAVQYGIDGTLSASGVNTLLNLQFPQSYEAIKNRLGFPAYRSSTADYYKLPDGRWVKVAYSESGKATGFQFGDRQ